MPSARAVVWVVDDSPLDAERARQVLGQVYDVQVFADGSAMLEHLAGHPAPDVLVLDWVMPGVSGIEVCRFLRAGQGARANLGILLLTMQNRTDAIVEGLAAGANDYLVKPYADPELLARVDALVRWNKLLDRAQKAEASVLQLLEHAPDPLITIDRDRRITYVNGEAQRVLDDTAHGLAGRLLDEVLPALSLEPLVSAARVSLPMADIEIGEQIFSPTVRSLPGTGEDASLTIALRDVTLRRRKEARRLDFYSVIAHDLRSPLGAMLMRTDLMLRGHRGMLSAEMIADLRKMDGNIRRLVALINDFLDFARMEDAGHKMERARVDVAGLIGDVLDEFRPVVESTHQQLRQETTVGSLIALGDKSRLQQVLTNLVANAIKFTPPGGHITVRGRQLGAWCELGVEDDGPGIAAETLPRLFKRYSRADFGRQAGGTGLGLLIVREIVEAHGGTVGVESTPGKGSRFWLRIPAAESAVAEPLSAAAESPA